MHPGFARLDEYTEGDSKALLAGSLKADIFKLIGDEAQSELDASQHFTFVCTTIDRYSDLRFFIFVVS